MASRKQDARSSKNIGVAIFTCGAWKWLPCNDLLPQVPGWGGGFGYANMCVTSFAGTKLRHSKKNAFAQRLNRKCDFTSSTWLSLWWSPDVIEQLSPARQLFSRNLGLVQVWGSRIKQESQMIVKCMRELRCNSAFALENRTQKTLRETSNASALCKNDCFKLVGVANNSTLDLWCYEDPEICLYRIFTEDFKGWFWWLYNCDLTHLMVAELHVCYLFRNSCKICDRNQPSL